MLRGLGGLGAAVMASALAVAAQNVTNPKFGYRLAAPDGWTVILDKEDPSAIVAVLEGAKGVPLCMAGADARTPVPGQTQSQINEDMREPFSKKYWKDSSTRSFENLVVESNTSRLHPSGLQSQESVLAYRDGEDKRAMKIKMAYMRAVRATYTIICGSETSEFATYLPAFDAIIESFSAQSGESVDANTSATPSAQTVSGREMGHDTRDAIAAAASKFSAFDPTLVHGTTTQ